MMIGKKEGTQDNRTVRKGVSITKFSVNLRTYLGYCFTEFIHQKGWLVFPGTALIMLILLTVLNKDEMFVYYSETRNGIFCITCAAIWVGIFNSVQSICKERDALKHEHMQDQIYFGAYVLAHVLYETFLCLVEAGIIQAFIMSAFRSGLADHPILPIRLYVTLVLILLSSDTMGLLLSGIVKNATTAMTVMPFLLILQLVMAGVIFELSGAANAMSYVTVAKWGMTALCSCISINDLQMSKEIDQVIFHHHFTEYSSGLAHLISVWAAMLLIGVICTIVTTFALRLVDKDRR